MHRMQFQLSRIDCIFGIAINEQLGDAIIVTVIATGFEEPKQIKKRADAAASNSKTYVQPKVASSTGVVTSVEDINQDDEIPNFFFNR